VIEIPTLDAPASAIESMLKKRIDVDDVDVRLEDAFESEAITALAEIYADAPDLRRVMAVAALAVRKAYESDGTTVVNRAAIGAAHAERATMRGEA
jgi:hypothetical protein